jgi:hypothetical protein
LTGTFVSALETPARINLVAVDDRVGDPRVRGDADDDAETRAEAAAKNSRGTSAVALQARPSGAIMINNWLNVSK